MTKSLQIIVPTGAVLSMVSCATIANGTSQRIEVASEPPGATVYVDGAEVGTTPTEVVLSRRSRERELRVVEPSGDSYQRWVRPHMSDRVWLNALSGLFTGYWAWFRSAEDALEGNIGIGIAGFMLPWAVDFAPRRGVRVLIPDRLRPPVSGASAVRAEAVAPGEA